MARVKPICRRIQRSCWRLISELDTVTLEMPAAARFALGTFAAADGRPFTGLVRGERATDLGPHLGAGVTVRALIDDWDRSLPWLQALADRLAPDEDAHRLDD